MNTATLPISALTCPCRCGTPVDEVEPTCPPTWDALSPGQRTELAIRTAQVANGVADEAALQAYDDLVEVVRAATRGQRRSGA